MTIIGLILLSYGMALVINYFACLLWYYCLAVTTKTSSMGVKKLKYQEYNKTWSNLYANKL
jgi:hypothetical protein